MELHDSIEGGAECVRVSWNEEEELQVALGTFFHDDAETDGTASGCGCARPSPWLIGVTIHIDESDAAAPN